MHGLVICSQDNIKRVIEFLIDSQILKESPQDPEMNKLWNKSWDSIGAFFKEMKAKILKISQNEEIRTV